MPCSASASETTASSAVPVPSFVSLIISFQQPLLLVCPPPVDDVSSVSERSGRTLTALDATSSLHPDSPCPACTPMTRYALLTFTAAILAPPCATPRCSSRSITLTSRPTLLSLAPKPLSLPPSPGMPPVLPWSARSSLFVSSVDETFSSITALPPDHSDASLMNPFLIGSLILTTPALVMTLLILMTSMTITSKTTCKPHLPVWTSADASYDE